jgi:hypothetical protein
MRMKILDQKIVGKTIIRCAICAVMAFGLPMQTFASSGTALKGTQEQTDGAAYVAGDAPSEDPVSQEDDIRLVEDNKLDENGRRGVKVWFSDDAVFPYSIILAGSESDVSFTIDYSGQELLIKPDTYKVKSVRDGNNTKLDSGATLVIDTNTEVLELDFTNPNKIRNFSLKGFIGANAGFIVLAAVAFCGFRAYCAYNGIRRR